MKLYDDGGENYEKKAAVVASIGCHLPRPVRFTPIHVDTNYLSYLMTFRVSSCRQ